MEEIIKQVLMDAASQKETFIKEAINKVLGTDDWDMIDIARRGEIKILPDKTEIFTFDGIDLLHFGPIKISGM